MPSCARKYIESEEFSALKWVLSTLQYWDMNCSVSHSCCPVDLVFPLSTLWMIPKACVDTQVPHSFSSALVWKGPSGFHFLFKTFWNQKFPTEKVHFRSSLLTYINWRPWWFLRGLLSDGKTESSMWHFFEEKEAFCPSQYFSFPWYVMW